MVQERRKDGSPYKARSWLGVITAGKLWMDFRNVQNDRSLVEERTNQLLMEIAVALEVDTSGPARLIFYSQGNPKARQLKDLFVSATTLKREHKLVL